MKTRARNGNSGGNALESHARNLLVLRGVEVASALEGRDAEVVHLVKEAYKTHALGDTSLPHSSFVFLPGQGNRIIALPGFLGGQTQAAGVKWIASVPANIERGMDRASALIVLNDIETGFPHTIIEGSLVSARRTAASAILMSGILNPMPQRLALVGCGLINFEIVRMMAATFSSLDEVILFDLQRKQAEAFKTRLATLGRVRKARIVDTIEEACNSSLLISIATTASQPHIHDRTMFRPGAAILHISLRDLSPELVLNFDNIVDDQDHVCRAGTSVHLAEKIVGNRQFIRCTLGDILLKPVPARKDAETPVVFSPFGLGVLDLAVSNFVAIEAAKRGMGTSIESFSNDPWRREFQVS